MGLVFAMLQQPVNCDCRRAEYLSVSGECCPMCGRGYVVRKDCTDHSATSCIPCLAGTYMDEPNGYDKCRKCKVCDSGLGLYTLRECTTTDDAICDVLDNHYCVDSLSGCSLAEKHTVCLAGERIRTPGSKISDTVCEDCPKGQYSKDGVNCTVWTDCDAIGKQKDEEGSAISDVTCTDSPRKHIISIVVLILFLLNIFWWTRQWKKSFIPVEERSKGCEENCQDSQIPVGNDERDHLKYPIPESVQTLSSDSGFASANIPEESEDHQDKRHEEVPGAVISLK